jgi:hypothetical protein
LLINFSQVFAAQKLLKCFNRGFLGFKFRFQVIINKLEGLSELYCLKHFAPWHIFPSLYLSLSLSIILSLFIPFSLSLSLSLSIYLSPSSPFSLSHPLSYSFYFSPFAFLLRFILFTYFLKKCYFKYSF